MAMGPTRIYCTQLYCSTVPVGSLRPLGLGSPSARSRFPTLLYRSQDPQWTVEQDPQWNSRFLTAESYGRWVTAPPHTSGSVSTADRRICLPVRILDLLGVSCSGSVQTLEDRVISQLQPYGPALTERRSAAGSRMLRDRLEHARTRAAHVCGRIAG
jgi:hypothetical protein